MQCPNALILAALQQLCNTNRAAWPNIETPVNRVRHHSNQLYSNIQTKLCQSLQACRNKDTSARTWRLLCTAPSSCLAQPRRPRVVIVIRQSGLLAKTGQLEKERERERDREGEGWREGSGIAEPNGIALQQTCDHGFLQIDNPKGIHMSPG